MKHVWIFIVYQEILTLTQTSVTSGYSGHICNASLGHHYTNYDGKCEAGMAWDPDVACCRSCDICGPGWHQPSYCITPCKRCPEGEYSDLAHNIRCVPCTQCEQLHRTTLQPCSPTWDARCGQCLPGYSPDVEHQHNPSHKCLFCISGCSGLNSRDTNFTTSNPNLINKRLLGDSESLYSLDLSSLALLVLVIVLVLVVVAILIIMHHCQGIRYQVTMCLTARDTRRTNRNFMPSNSQEDREVFGDVILVNMADIDKDNHGLDTKSLTELLLDNRF